MRKIDILVPELPESIVKATIITWHKNPGDMVLRNEILVEIETDKVILEIPSLVNGILDSIIEIEGATVVSNQVIGHLYEKANINKDSNVELKDNKFISIKNHKSFSQKQDNNEIFKEIKHSLHKSINANITKDTDIEDTESCIINKNKDRSFVKNLVKKEKETRELTQITSRTRSKKRIPMTNLRRCIAKRLLEAKNSTAMLTTFNEVNMKSIIDLRRQYGKKFKENYGINLSFMSFYVQAVVESLKRYPEINATIDGDDIIYFNYIDINIAVSTSRGLVTPILRDVDLLSLADIERKIKEFVIKSRSGKLTIEELTSGNFTITNSGVFGSLISTPIINPPQSAILGIHDIKDRPMAINGKIEILPMMYLALSYDHRLVDGRESINFLITIKRLLEDPICLLLGI